MWFTYSTYFYYFHENCGIFSNYPVDLLYKIDSKPYLSKRRVMLCDFYEMIFCGWFGNTQYWYYGCNHWNPFWIRNINFLLKSKYLHIITDDFKDGNLAYEIVYQNLHCLDRSLLWQRNMYLAWVGELIQTFLLDTMILRNISLIWVGELIQT